MDVNRPGHRRARSLDLTDSLERIELLRKRRQQFLDNRAKFNVDQKPPSTEPPPIPKSLPHIRPIDKVEPNDSSEPQQERSVTPISELIQRFTAEMLSPNATKVDFQSPSTDTTHSAPSTFLEPPAECESLPSVFAVPFKPPNWIKYNDENSEAETEAVTLRRPSDFLRNEFDASYETRSLIETETSSVQKPIMSITDPAVFESISHSPKAARKAQAKTTSDLPFHQLHIDETDSRTSDYPSWIPLSSCTSREYTSRPHLVRASSFQSVPVTERRTSTSSEAAMSSLPYASETQSWRNTKNNYNPASKFYIMTNSKEQRASKFESKYTEAVNQPKPPRRHSSNSFSFLRRSHTPTVPVKALVQKFSSNN